MPITETIPHLDTDIGTSPEFNDYWQGVDLEARSEEQLLDMENGFITAALQGRIEGVGKYRAWSWANEYLRKIADLHETVNSGDGPRVTSYYNLAVRTGSALAESVASVKVHPHNVGRIVESLESLYLNPLATSFHDRHKATKTLPAKHGAIMRLAKGEALERYKKLLGEPGFFGSLGDLFMTYDTDDEGYVANERLNHEAYGRNKRFLQDIFQQLGLDDVGSFIFAWTGTNKETGRDVISSAHHLRVMAEVEAERPGALKLLNNFYGIRAFGRYEKLFLTQQFDQHGNNDLPYGIFISALADHNGAFGSTKHSAPGLNHRLGGDYLVRAVEAKNRFELRRRLLTLHQFYGPNRKISFAVVSAHGSPESFALGEWYAPGSRVSKGTPMHRLPEIFVPNPVIALESCSTGQEKGIAQEISANLAATVVAPPVDAGSIRILIGRDKGQLKLEPMYGVLEDDKNPFSDRLRVNPILYKNGQQITGEEYQSYFEELDQEWRDNPHG